MQTLEIQRALLARGYDIGPAGADGDAGPDTIKAVEAFQAMHGLVVDGLVGPKTSAILRKPFNRKKPAPALKVELPEPGWLTLARADLGTVEGIGRSNNPKVVLYFKDAGFAGIKDDATAWCAASLGAWLHRSGHKPSGSLAARSYERWGVGLAEPVLGCVATKRRGNSAWQGHVFLVVGASRDKVFGIGGNQSDAVTVATFNRSEITSFRWPIGVPIPTDPRLPTTIAGAKSGGSEA